MNAFERDNIQKIRKVIAAFDSDIGELCDLLGIAKGNRSGEVWRAKYVGWSTAQMQWLLDILERAPDDLLTSGEVAQIWRVDTKTVSRWANAGLITGLQTPGGTWRFRRADIEGAGDERR